MTRYWTCRCGQRWQRITQVCECGGRRPKPSRPKHKRALDLPYEEYVARYGELCGICGRGPSENRRLDRDHDHTTGEPRGLLCHRCNRALPNWATTEWLRQATRYLEEES